MGRRPLSAPLISRAVALGAVLVAGACVPTAPDPNPRGGVGVIFAPSPATSGAAPILTTDGWTVHVDTLVIEVSVAAEPEGDGTSSGAGVFRFLATTTQEVVIRAISVGPARISLQQAIANIPGNGGVDHLTDPPSAHGIDPALDARFLQPSDDEGGRLFGELDDPSFVIGAAVLLAAHGEKNGRTVRFELGFVGSNGSDVQSRVDVQPNVLNPATLAVRAEAMFTNFGPFVPETDTGSGDSGDDDTSDVRQVPVTPTLVFDDIANADLDRDGVVSPAEFRHEVPAVCVGCAGGDVVTSLATQFQFRAASLIVAE